MPTYRLDVHRFGTGRGVDRSEEFIADNDTDAMAHLNVFADQLPARDAVWLYSQGTDRSIASRDGAA